MGSGRGVITDGAPPILTVVNAIGSALVAGVFFAFSAFVMAGLGRAPAEAGTAAMQGINVTAPTAPFMIAFLGTGAKTLNCNLNASVLREDARSFAVLDGGGAEVLSAEL